MILQLVSIHCSLRYFSDQCPILTLSDYYSEPIYINSRLIQLQFLGQSVCSVEEGPRTFDWSGVEMDLSEVYHNKIKRRKAKIGNNLSENSSVVDSGVGLTTLSRVIPVGLLAIKVQST